MPITEKDTGGSNPTSNSSASSRKEKKKQAKEERDRLKQVEKKKRRLEKALATAAAIRTELEKKKQKRKEEEQRLDEEGAALAEAVALQVLVDEDVDVDMDLGRKDAGCTGNEGFAEKEMGSIDIDSSFASTMRIPRQSFELQQHVTYTYPTVAESHRNSPNKDFLHEWEVSVSRAFVNAGGGKLGKHEQLQGEQGDTSDWEILSNADEKLKASNEKAKAAEMAAGIAAAQAVAALRIAEEARAEAEAAKKVAEAAMSQVLDRNDSVKNHGPAFQVKFQQSNTQVERDELKARLEETERQLKARTRQVIHLEQNLEDVTHYLLELQAKLPVTTVGELETSERESTTITESSGGTVDQ